MNIEFPKVEYIISNKQEKLNKEQIGWYKLLSLRESILNLSIKDYVGLAKDDSPEIYVSSFLDSLYFNIQRYLFRECENSLLFDDFVYIASVAAKALKAIVEKPSTKLIKVDEQVKYNRITNSGIKTMQWLAKKPGSTIVEKISPRNKVLTVSTKFSVDTKENEASMYLYDVLYKILGSRLFKAECRTCKNENCQQKKTFDELLRLYTLNTTIRQSELAEIPKVRHSVQNNKLMCDKFYKTVWDCNLKINRIEKELKKEWENLENIIYKDMFFYIASIIKQLPNIKIKDQIGKLKVDENGFLSFSGMDKITFVELGKEIKEYTLHFNDNKISIMSKSFVENAGKFRERETSENQISLSTIIVDILNYIEHPELAKKEDVKELIESGEKAVVEIIKEHKISEDYKISKMKLSKKCLRFYSDANIETVGDFFAADKDTFETYDSYKKKYLEDVLTILRADGYDL